MITQLSIVHFKAIASATIPLGPITVLVGPNDSGKSTILQALMALSRAGDRSRLTASQLLECSTSLAATNGDTQANIEISVDGLASLGSGRTRPCAYRYMMQLSSQADVVAGEDIQWDGKPMLTAVFRGPRVLHPVSERAEGWPGLSTELSCVSNEAMSNRNSETKPVFDAVANDLRATLLRLDARAIARPSPLGAPLLSDGSGLVGIVDELLTSGIGDEQIERVNEVIRKLSPHVKRIAAKLHPGGGKELHFALRSGTVVPASQMSDGVVLAAALAVIALGARTPRLLIEEPENGLHPRQLKIVADTIRSIAEIQGTQIILTTHSPLLLNHFGAEEVVLVTRSEAGVQAQRMSEARGLDELATELSLGELWYNVGDSDLVRPA